MSDYTNAPSRFEPDEDRTLRIQAGVALCRSVLAGKTGPATDAPEDDELTDPHRRAKARAAEERRRRGDPTPIGDTLPQIRQHR